MTDSVPAPNPVTGTPYPPLPAPIAAAAPPVVPAHPSMLARRWPAPSDAARPAVLVAVAGAAAVGAASLPFERPGVGWLISSIAGSAALGVAVWSAIRPAAAQTADSTAQPARSRPGAGQLLWAAATVALLGVGTVRAAEWLFALCVLAAAATACLSLTAGRSTRGLLLACAVPPVAAIRSVPWARAGLARSGRIGGRSMGRIGATVAASLALLLVFGALFSAADAAFADLLDSVTPDVSAGYVSRWVFLFPALALGLLAAAFLLTAPPDLTGLENPATRRLRRMEWAVPVALLDALFVAFVLVQVTYLFGGSDHVLATTGLTYAEYARSGFWQLLAVSALTLLVIAAAARWAPRSTRTDRLLIRVLLGLLAVLSLVVVASALFRMNVYQQAYGFTRLRILVSVAELWLGLLFVLVVAAGIRLRAAWVPRLAVATAVLALLGLAALNPDRFIADRNIDRYAETGRIDVWYLSRLSADAVPALDRLPTPLRDCAVRDSAWELSRQRDGWHEWNLARAQARQLLSDTPPGAAVNCAAALSGIDAGWAPRD